MIRILAENGKIENGALTCWMQAYLPVRANEPLLQEDLRDAEWLQHVERWWMKGRGPQVIGNGRLGIEGLH